MTKVKELSGEGTTPRHCYFWIATITNNSVIPEYDFSNKQHRKVCELFPEYVKMFSWYPVTLDMVIKVKKEFNENLKLAIDNKVHSLAIDLDDGERLKVHPVWRNIINFMGGAGCKTCYALFKDTKDGVKGYWMNENGEIES